MAEVSVSEPKGGEDPIAIAARERAGRKQANQIIGNFRSWYQDVRNSFGEGQ